MNPLWLVVFLTVSVSAEYENSSLPEDRIVGGVPINIEDAPYQVGVYYYNDIIFCGGSIITRYHVLTAAHCTYDQKSVQFKPSSLRIRAGSPYAFGLGEVHKVAKIVPHPYYDSRTMNNDIAIFKFEIGLTFGPNIAAIRLPSLDFVVKTNQDVRVSGWGLLREESIKPTQLQAVTVQVISRTDCEAVYSISSSMFCAGVPKGYKDACHGDSGGPAVINNILAGVVSWGIGCARPSQPGVYTDVVSHLGFIYHGLHS
ncbi:trypsin-3 [Tribolium castaneum]|uniref:Serine protease P124 n=1 Tax=Tribolium castaneum TaxID=7070 RepID=D6X4Y6_TRICA|nr:PREDICTED: trypsin-3 [Tribolium castaneum]EEZ97698.1 serine protease P124 [Tribolium castaneum]|eukprot:XP_001811283.1 PREDICTED: trypsin-3 [Tribolium castaneum]